MSEKVILKYSGLGPVSMDNGASGVLTIKPGIGTLTKKEFEVMKKHPDIKKMLERGINEPDGCDKSGMGNLSIIESGDSETKGTDDSGTVDKSKNVPGNQVEAKELIANTENTELLDEWLENETRAGVKNSIEKKIKEIEDYRDEHGDKD